MKLLVKFLKLPLAEKILHVEALIAVISAGFVLRLVPFRFIRRSLARRLSSDVTEGPVNWAEIHTIVRSVNFFSRFHPFASCLSKAVAALLLIKHKGGHAVLKIGVAKDEHKNFIAHAWLETNGRIVIGKLPPMSKYTVLNTLSD
jgi:hypothetical protein